MQQTGIWADMTGWKKWSTGNCARDLKLAMLTKWSIYKTESALENETHNVLREKEITLSRPENQT